MRSLLALLLILLLGGAAPSKDWSRTASESAEGWTFGRPGAPLLAEYASFGCPTCGRFAAASGQAIAEAVKAGKLRLSFRPFLIFPHDRAATVLARCVPGPQRLGFIKAVLAAQPATKAKLGAIDGDDGLRRRLFEAELAGPEAQASVLGLLTGLSDLAVKHGLRPDAAGACLADKANHAWLTEADMSARMAGITGTPTYVLAGRKLPTELTPEQLVAHLPR